MDIVYYKQQIGKLGEDLACRYLEASHYKIIERNFLCYQGEIDIIAKDLLKKELVFIEVKTRSNLKYGTPEEAITEKKLKHLQQAIKYYVYKNHINDISIRVDVIGVLIKEPRCRIEHIKQIW